MKLNFDQRETLLRLATPGLVTDVREMLTFSRRHRLRLADPRAYRAYREARRFGISLLPPMSLEGLVVDVGANEGQFASALLGVAPNARVLAFEPEPDTAHRLRARFAGDNRVSVREAAVGSSHGEARLHITNNTVFASLHEPLEGLAMQYPPGVQEIGSAVVSTVTLDDELDETVDILKIDVQGGEWNVLAGASHALEHTNAVLLEMNFLALYNGEASLGDMHEAMLRAGFVLYGFGEPRRSMRTSALLWADVCYARV